MLLLVMKHEKSEEITKSGRKAPRNSTPTADDNDSGACSAVAQRPCLGRGWVTAADAHCGLRGRFHSAVRLQNHRGTYSTLSLGACFLRISHPGPAAKMSWDLQSWNPSIFSGRTVFLPL
ncbi:hypothetical protein Y032_0070g483 [Ancylostoma ceylanicum]|nr:hypothetical protein Y032_0070g483 [Ancylostoma ceylanicum]